MNDKTEFQGGLGFEFGSTWICTSYNLQVTSGCFLSLYCARDLVKSLEYCLSIRSSHVGIGMIKFPRKMSISHRI